MYPSNVLKLIDDVHLKDS